MTLSATATCSGGTAEYAFYVQPSGGSWTQVCGYSSSSTCNWTNPTDGYYSIQATARSSGSIANTDSSSAVEQHQIGSGVCGSVVLDVDSPASPSAGGTTVTLSMTASCTGGTAQYAFYVEPSGGSWTQVCGYSASSTCSWTNPATGTYSIQATARSSASSASTDSSSSLGQHVIQSAADGGADGGGSDGGSDAGSTLVTLASSTNPYGITIDGVNVYWTTDFGTSSVVMKVPLGGGTATTLASGQDQVISVAVDSTNVYWTTAQAGSGTVMTVPIAGDPHAPREGEALRMGSQSDSTSVYWADGTLGTVMSVPVGGVPDGGAPTTLASGQKLPYAVTVDSTSVYWTNFGTSAGSYKDYSVMKVALGGGTPATLASGYAVSSNDAFGIAVDANSVYWTNSNGTVMSVPLNGGTLSTLATGQLPASSTEGIAVDSTSVYWANTNAERVVSVPIGGGTITTLKLRRERPLQHRGERDQPLLDRPRGFRHGADAQVSSSAALGAARRVRPRIPGSKRFTWAREPAIRN